MSEIVDDESDFVALTKESVRNKIKHVLLIYPKISMSMLQVGIGTGIPPKFWHPIFKQMEAEGLISVEVKSFAGPNNRDQVYKIVQLIQP